MLGSVISSVWRLMRGSGGVAPFESPLLQIARRIHQQRLQLSQQQTGQLTQQQSLQQQAEQPMQQAEQPPAQPGQPMPSFGPYDQNQFLHSLLSGATRSMFRRPWSMGQPGQQMPPSQPSLAQILMRLLGR